ncbi:MAG: glycosyltransferase [Desulfoprunum sp.]|jgi:glycosyltransferase involved in cell wall biosynthesis|uniref:glycosyltransferase family 2 protein n=1 Tax=Desulfoprunum sp. TaxID=2020866 RepID=UPI003C735F2F
MSAPLVSVIIPAYNHERFVGAAVESVLGQSCADLELIVIDDGSRDRTGEVVQSYTDPRLSYYHQENQDAYNTINRGLGLARGEYTAILNSDDVYALNRLQRLVECRDETGAECLFTDVIPISDEGEEFADPAFGWNLWHRKNRAFYRECGDLYTAFLKGNFMVTTSNLFMTTRAVRAVGKFCSLRYLHDYDYIFRMMLANPGRVHYLEDEKLLYYRIHAGNTLGEAAIAGRLQDQELIRRYLLEVIPAAQRGYVAAGADRLVELERELQAVRAALQPNGEQGVRPAARQLARSLKTWLRKRLA